MGGRSRTCSGIEREGLGCALVCRWVEPVLGKRASTYKKCKSKLGSSSEAARTRSIFDTLSALDSEASWTRVCVRMRAYACVCARMCACVRVCKGVCA